jgi:hypothetical protein
MDAAKALTHNADPALDSLYATALKSRYREYEQACKPIADDEIDRAIGAAKARLAREIKRSVDPRERQKSRPRMDL